MLERPTTRARQRQQVAAQQELGKLESAYGFDLGVVIGRPAVIIYELIFPWVMVVVFVTLASAFFSKGIFVGAIGTSILFLIGCVLVAIILNLLNRAKSIFLYE